MPRPPRSHQSKSSEGRHTRGDDGSRHSASGYLEESEEQEVQSPLKQRGGTPSEDREELGRGANKKLDLQDVERQSIRKRKSKVPNLLE